jgi:hypothetical protein
MLQGNILIISEMHVDPCTDLIGFDGNAVLITASVSEFVWRRRSFVRRILSNFSDSSEFVDEEGITADESTEN